MQLDEYFLQKLNKIFIEAQPIAFEKLKKNEDASQINYTLKCLNALSGKIFYFIYILDNRCRCYIENIPINYQLSKLCRACIRPTLDSRDHILRMYKLAGIHLSVECKKIIKDWTLLEEFFSLIQKKPYVVIISKITKNLPTADAEYLQVYCVIELLFKLGRLNKANNCLNEALLIAKDVYLHGAEKHLMARSSAGITLEYVYIVYTFSK
jgi:hypothetical protein